MDLIDSVAKEFYESGMIKSEIPFIDGDTSGNATLYYENGHTKFEITYLEDKRDGEQKEYYPTGKLKTDTFYHEGELQSVDRYDEHENKIE